MEEEYFVFTMKVDAPEFEAVLWCETLEEAIKEKRERQKKFPSEAKLVYIGKIIHTGKD